MKYDELLAPTLSLEGTTLVMDTATQRQVMWIDGVLPLAVGTEIELAEIDDGLLHCLAIVTGVRLLAAAGSVGVQLCVDCTVPQEWWEAHPAK